MVTKARWVTAPTHRGDAEDDVFPGLTEDINLEILARFSHRHHGLLESVSNKWKDLIRNLAYAACKAEKGLLGKWLFVLTEHSENQWVVYDPEANVWHMLPKTPTDCDNLQHFGFACVCLRNRMLVIGCSYVECHTVDPSETPLITNTVLQFDTYRKRWTRLCKMHTPRTNFACAVISGKMYVAGGRNIENNQGLSSAEP